jgi:hypothetical protein
VTVPTECWVLPRPRADFYVGSWPRFFEKKLYELLDSPKKALYPFAGLAGGEAPAATVLHTVDLNASTTPTWVGDAHDMHWIADESYDLVLCDPPYSDEEAEWLYGTPKLKPARYVAEAVRVCRVGGHVAIYHRHQPKRPPGTRLVHRVVILTRTGHAPRLCFVFEKMSADQIAAFSAAA